MDLNKIYHGDCIELMRELPDDSVDMVMFDAPFYQLRDKATKDNKLALYKSWIADMFTGFYRILKDGGNVCYLNAPKYIYHTMGDIFNLGFEYRNDIPLIRPSAFRPAYMLGFQHNILMFLVKGDKKLKWSGSTTNHDDSFPSDVWDDIKYRNGFRNRGGWHPEAISVELTSRCIVFNSNVGDLVFDPCMGSGTTAIAAIRNNRKFIGFELNEDYFKLASDRIRAEQIQLTFEF